MTQIQREQNYGTGVTGDKRPVAKTIDSLKTAKGTYQLLETRYGVSVNRRAPGTPAPKVIRVGDSECAALWETLKAEAI